MKKLYYLIWVDTNQDTSGYKDSTMSGYYTGIYSVNKGKYVGYSSDPSYSEVKRFSSQKTAQNHIDKVLNTTDYGGESNSVSYTFNVIPVELEETINDRSTSISKSDRLNASYIIKQCLSKENVINYYRTFCLDNNLNSEDSEKLLNAINTIYNNILRLL